MSNKPKYSEVAAEAYQVIGVLADSLGYFTDDVDEKLAKELTRALDYFAALMCEEKKPFEILPFGGFDPECQKSIWQKQQNETDDIQRTQVPVIKTHKCSMADVCKSTACKHAIPHEPKDCTGPAPCGVWPNKPWFKPMVFCIELKMESI